MTQTEERIRELTKSMLRKKLYVVLSRGGAASGSPSTCRGISNT